MKETKKVATKGGKSLAFKENIEFWHFINSERRACHRGGQSESNHWPYFLHILLASQNMECHNRLSWSKWCRIACQGKTQISERKEVSKNVSLSWEESALSALDSGCERLGKASIAGDWAISPNCHGLASTNINGMIFTTTNFSRIWMFRGFEKVKITNGGKNKAWI